MSKETPGKKENPAKMFLSGGFGGICTVVSGHPLDTIKVRLQTMPKPLPGEMPMFTGTFDCAKKTIKNEGPLGLYKGMLAPLLGVTPIFAICFASYSLGKRIQQTSEDHVFTYPQIYFAGAFSAVFTTGITAPGERIKCLLQIQQASGAERKYKGVLDCAQKLYKEGGLRSIYKGTAATLLRDVPANGIYFVTYEFLKDAAKTRTGNDNVGLWSALFAGGMAGMAYWIYGMPADVLKSRLQTAPEGTYEHGIRSVFKELITTDGPMALYRGVTPVMLRAFPANAACFFGIELANMFFRKILPNF